MIRAREFDVNKPVLIRRWRDDPPREATITSPGIDPSCVVVRIGNADPRPVKCTQLYWPEASTSSRETGR